MRGLLMNIVRTLLTLILLLGTLVGVLAVDLVPQGNVNLKGRYNLTNASYVCLSDDCRSSWPSSGGNDSWNESYANTLYASISTIPDNTSWNQSHANTLYASISIVPDNRSWNESRANSLYTTPAYVSGAIGANLTLAAINTNMGNWSKDKTTLPNLTLAQIATNMGNWSGDKPSYATLTQLNAGANLTLAAINANLGNASKHVGNCGVGMAIQNITATGIQCAAASGGGDNTSWNQSLGDTLYYPRNTNPLGFYNSTTLPASGGDNTSWNESRANALYTTPAYVSGAVGQNLTYALITTTNGNWSLDKVSYATLTQLNAGANLTYALINANLGNWSKDKSTLPNLTYAQIATNIGNWSADKSGYATLTQLNAGANLTLAAINTNMGNYSANPAGYYNITTLPASGGDNTSWNESRANALYSTFSYVAGAVGQNLTYALITTANGNWSLDKSSYATLTQLNAGVGQNLTYALINTNMGNYSANPAGYYNSTTLPSTAYQSSAAGWTNTTTMITTSLNVNITSTSNLTMGNGTLFRNDTCFGLLWSDGSSIGVGTGC